MSENTKPSLESATSALDRETIAFFVEIATTLGFPRSIGEIFGALYVTPRPMNADELSDRLGLSRSGVGQGLKTLLEMGAIRPAISNGNRKDYFEVQSDLGVLVRLFLSSRVLPRLEELGRKRALLAEESRRTGHDHLCNRFSKLDRWSAKTKPLMTVLKALAKE